MIVDESEPKNTSSTLTGIIDEINLSELERLDKKFADMHKDLAIADEAAKSMVEPLPQQIYTAQQQSPEPVLSSESKSEQTESELTGGTEADITAPAVDVKRNITVDEVKENPSKPVAQQDQAQSTQQDFNKTLAKSRREMDQAIAGLKRDTAHLDPVPDIYKDSKSVVDDIAKSELESPDKKSAGSKKPDATKNEVPVLKEPEAPKQVATSKDLPDWVTQPLNKKNTEVKNEPPAVVEKSQEPKQEKPTLEPQPTPAWADKFFAEMDARKNKPPEPVTPKDNITSSIEASPSVPVAPAVKQDGTLNQPPVNRPNITGQIQSVVKGLNDISPALDIFNFKSFVNQGIKEGAAMRGIPNINNMESLLKQLPFTQILNPPTRQSGQNQSVGQPAFPPSFPFNFNLGGILPNIAEEPQQEKITSNSDTNLQGINQNLNKLSLTIQQSQQTLINSLNNLNNTANEILRTIPNISMNQNQTSGPSSSKNRSHFSPTESSNLIGTFRDSLNLTPRTFPSNTIFPGNNSIA